MRCAKTASCYSVFCSGLTLGGDLFSKCWVGENPYFNAPKLPPKLPCSAGEYSSAYHGRLHSQPLRVNNVPNNYVTVFGLPCEKVHPPLLPSLCCVTVCKWEKTKV